MNKKTFILSLFGLKLIFLIGLFFFSNAVLFAQTEENKPLKKQKARISLDYTNINNNSPRLTATIKTKVDRSYENVPGVKVNFYFGEVSKAAYMGYTMTGKNGQAILILPESLKKILAKQNDFLYLATIENDERFKDQETEIEIKRSFTELSLSVKDSVKQVRLFIGAPDSTGIIIPTEEVDVRIYVKRLFGLLPITEEVETSDEEGNVLIDFPNDIPGDENGNLTIVAQIEDNDLFGNLINSKKIDWGVPLQFDSELISGELWSARANAPLSMVVIINVMIIGIWGIIAYIIFQLIKIKKIGTTQLES